MASYPIFDVSGWPSDRDEPMGSKEKMWLIHPEGGRWLWKANRRQHGEDWAEKIASELAEALGLPHSKVELAVQSGQKGIITLDFVRDRTAYQLVHGNELLLELDPAYPAKSPTFKLSQHTLPRVLDVLGQSFIHLPQGIPLPQSLTSPPELFVGYLLLDALAGNTDRHHENWAVIDFQERPAGKRYAGAGSHL